MAKYKNRIPSLLLIIIMCMLGYLAGIVTIALWQENWFIDEGILNQDFIYKMEDLNIDKRALFFLCFGKRFRAFFLLFILAFSSVNVFTNVLFFFLNGLYIGSIMELFIIRYGMQGLFMYLSLVFPHGLFYMIGFGILGCWCLGLEKIQTAQKNKSTEKLRKIRYTGRVGVAFFFVFLGVILESYVNLKIFYLTF